MKKTKSVGIWLDHERAVILKLEEQGEDVVPVISEARGRFLPQGGSASRGLHGVYQESIPAEKKTGYV